MRVIVDASFWMWNPDLMQELDRPSPGSGLAHLLMGEDRLDDLVSDPVHRIERRHRILEDHRDLLAANFPHLVLAQLHQVAALVEHLALDPHIGIVDQAQHGHHRDALPRPRLAHDAEHLALVDGERNAVHGANHPVLRAERDLEIPDLEQRLGHG